MAQKRKTTSAAAKAKAASTAGTKKAGARKTTAKRSTAKSGTASKSTAAKKTTAKKTTTRKTTAAKKTTTARKATAAKPVAKKTTTARKTATPKPASPPKAPIPVPMPMPAKPVATQPYFDVYESGTNRNNWFFSLYGANGQELITSFGAVTREMAEHEVQRAIAAGSRRSRYRIKTLADFESFFVLKDRLGPIAKSEMFWDDHRLDQAIRQTMRAIRAATIR